MAQRVNITVAAKLTGRSEKTLRTWLSETPSPLSVELGQFRGGRRLDSRHGGTGTVVKGRTRLLDVDELRALHEARGGTAWYAQYLPVPTGWGEVAELTARLAAVEAQLAALRERVPLIEQVARLTRSEGAKRAATPSYVPELPDTGEAAGGPLSASEEHIPAPVPVARDRQASETRPLGSWYSGNFVQMPPPKPGDFPSRQKAARFLHRHGIPEPTARSWWTGAPWPARPREALDEVLRRLAEPDAWRHQWRIGLHWCEDDPSCPCREMLNASIVVAGS
jgi:hypothetical protein